jgi:hypothetical protein
MQRSRWYPEFVELVHSLAIGLATLAGLGTLIAVGPRVMELVALN